jgi:UDP-perosamine 4-acetyltransferase
VDRRAASGATLELDGNVLFGEQAGLRVPLMDEDSPLPDGPLAMGIGCVARCNDPGTGLRARVFARFSKAGRNFPPVRDASAILRHGVRLADGAQVLAGAVIQTGTRIGANAVINTRASVDHDCVVGDHAFIAPGAVLCGGVQVGEGAFVGAGAIVIPGVRIGAGAVVGAGTIVRREVADGAFAGGRA